MKILVLNSGSSSIKYALIERPENKILASGLVQRIGEERALLDHKSIHGEAHLEQLITDHAAGLRLAIHELTDGAAAPLDDISEIGAVGHRVVHGGERFTEPVEITDEVIEAIEQNTPLAPLHNPANLQGIHVARALLPGVPQVAVFDTAFHQTMPRRAFLYALPHELYRSDRVRRYGFHGTSHRHVAQRAAALLGRPLDTLDLITCHLGNGASVTAIKQGRSIDTSMGMTPLEGLVMGTRSGDLDPAIIFHLMRTRQYDVDAVDHMLNKKSGLAGISEQSNDVRTLLLKKSEGDEQASVALDVYCYRIKKYIGAYAAALGHVDAIVFTAGVGENSPDIRAAVCENLSILGISIDLRRNEAADGVADISTDDSPVRVLVIPTDEEGMIASDTFAVAQRRGQPVG